MPSPLCTVNGSSTTNGVDVTSGTITIALVDITGVNTWSIGVYGQDDLVSIPVLVVNNTAKTATFTSPGAPWAMLFRSIINNGLDATGVNNSYTNTFKISRLTESGRRLAASNETLENNITTGWTSLLNGAIRDAPFSGTTGARPTITTIGFEYFDTTLGIPIWWKGAVWVNGAGATV